MVEFGWKRDLKMPQNAKKIKGTSKEYATSHHIIYKN
jgi:hypothetical protein